MNMTPITPRPRPLSMMEMMKSLINKVDELQTIIDTRIPETKYVQPEIPVIPEEPDPTLSPFYMNRDNEGEGEVVEGEVL